jgi:glycosyltransferase involved in cell wall biosynthesis
MIVSATRLEPEARVDVLLEALPRILREFPECRVTIAGSGSLALPLKRRAELLGVSEAVTWTGWLAEISPLLAAGHIYVNARPLEGFGMATAEAMGFGLPVIAVNAGAGPELVQDGVTGRLVPPADSTALAEGVCELLRNLRRASAMGARGRERATAAFSMHATAVSTLAFYERLAEHRQDR